MVFKTLSSLLPMIALIIVAIVISIIMLNYFNINMEDNNGFISLNRHAVYEGMGCKKSNKDQ